MFSRPSHWIIALALSLSIFAFSTYIYTRHNDLPAVFHPDEPSKVDQILTNDRNFYHPLLMLDAAQVVTKIERTPASPEAIARAGRQTSALLAAGAAVLLAWAGFFVADWAGFFLAGAAAMLCPAVLSHAHFFKEETALVFGMAAVICVAAAMIRWRERDLQILSILLGIALGLAASGKYVGAVMILPSLVLIVVLTWDQWRRMIRLTNLMLVGTAITWAAVNYRAIANIAGFSHGLGRETWHALEGHMDLALERPNAWFVRITWDEAMPHVKVMIILAPVALLLLARGRRRRNEPGSSTLMFGWWLILVIVCFTTLLCFNTLPFYRYAVPLTLMLHVLAALTVAWVAQSVRQPIIRGSIIIAALVAVVALQGQRCINYNDQFASDSRDALRTWINNSLTPDTSIAADENAELAFSGDGRPVARAKVQSAIRVADLGTIDALRAQGVEYVVAVGTSCERYADRNAKPARNVEGYARRERFYRTLFSTYPIVKQWTAKDPMRSFANPDIYVFRITTPPAVSAAQSSR